MQDLFDPERLSARPQQRGPAPQPPRHQPGERFLKGPIPWRWLAEAMRLPGRALHVATVLWFRAGLTRSATVSLSLSKLQDVGVARTTASRALAALERAGLVEVVRAPGRRPQVTILPYDRVAEGQEHGRVAGEEPSEKPASHRDPPPGTIVE